MDGLLMLLVFNITARYLSPPLQIITIERTPQEEQGEGGVAFQRLRQPLCSCSSHVVVCPTNQCMVLTNQWWWVMG